MFRALDTGSSRVGVDEAANRTGEGEEGMWNLAAAHFLPCLAVFV